MQAHGEGETLTAARCDECEVTTRWLGFYRVWQGSGEVFDTVDLFLPDVQFNTQVTRHAACRHANTHAAPRRSVRLPRLSEHFSASSCGLSTWHRSLLHASPMAQGLPF